MKDLLGLLKKREKADTEAEAPETESEADGEGADEAPAEPGRFDQLGARLHAWWEGYEFEPGAAEEEGDDGSGADSGAPAPASSPEAWTQARQDVVQKLWGDGFSTPGEAEHILMLVKPLGLNGQQTIIDINPGLGGTSRVVSEDTGAWVTGLEAQNDLAAAGMAMSAKTGMAKRAPIEFFEPPKIDVRAKTVDAMISKEGLYTLPEKEIFFEELYTALKPTAQILFTDYMMPDDGTSSPELDAWIEAEHPTPVPWSLNQTINRLKEIGFEVRVSEDMTDDLKALVLKGWQRLVSGFKPGSLSPEAAEAVLGEAEIWCRRMALFDANELRCYRIHAFKYESTL